MKQNRMFSLLAAEAILCIAFQFLRSTLPNLFSSLLAFPFSQLGFLLRTLSLSGKAGNAAAIVLYAALCLIPAALLLPICKKRKLSPEDGLLVLLTALLFPVLYFAVNPGLMGGSFAVSAELGIASCGGLLYSILCSWAVLRILRLLSAADSARLQCFLSIFLTILNVYFVWCAFGAAVGETLDRFSAVREANQGNEHLLSTTYAFLILQGILQALPYLLDVIIVFAGLQLLRELRLDRYSEAAVAAAEQLALRCRQVLVVTVLTVAGFNLLQFLFADSLHVINGTLYIPLFSLGFCLTVLLLSRFILENKQLKDDNDLFI